MSLGEPVLPLLLLGAALSFALALGAPRARPVAVALGSILITLAVLEAAAAAAWRRDLARSQRKGGDPSAPVGLMVTRGPAGLDPSGRCPDRRLGWRYAPDVEITDRGFTGPPGRGAWIDTCYTIGPLGWRLNAVPALPGAPVALFFGDSFQYGLRVGDAETVASRFVERSRGRWDGLNLAVSGWGPHQTVALLEHRIEEAPLRGRRASFGVYLSLFDPERPVGALGWGRSGPRFELVDGALRQRGNLEDDGAIASALRRSRLFGRLARAFHTARAEDALYEALLVRARDLFVERYRAPFVVVLCGRGPSRGRLGRLVVRLGARGVRAVVWEDLLPRYRQRLREYHVPGDLHPSALANVEVAEWLLREAGDPASRGPD